MIHLVPSGLIANTLYVVETPAGMKVPADGPTRRSVKCRTNGSPMLAGASTGISIVQCGSSAACTTAAGPDATIDTHDDTIARTRNTDICAAARQPRPAFAVFIGKSQP